MLLLDNNLSPKLCRRLEPVFPGNQHVENVGLDNSPDSEVWKYAKANQLAILTKDSDFNHMALLLIHPGKIQINFENKTRKIQIQLGYFMKGLKQNFPGVNFPA